MTTRMTRRSALGRVAAGAAFLSATTASLAERLAAADVQLKGRVRHSVCKMVLPQIQPRRSLGVPGRHEIDETQEINYPAVMKAIVDTGFKGHVAQEFVPARPDVLASLKQGVTICDVWFCRDPCAPAGAIADRILPRTDTPGRRTPACPHSSIASMVSS